MLRLAAKEELPVAVGRALHHARAATNLPACIRINREITAAHSTKEIFQICGRGELAQFDGVNFATAIHRIARLLRTTVTKPLCKTSSVHAAAVEERDNVRHMLLVGDSKMLWDELLCGSHRSLPFFGAQALANTAWSLSTLRCKDLPLMDAIASASIPSLCAGSTVGSQELANTAWSFSSLRVSHNPLFHALASAARPSL